MNQESERILRFKKGDRQALSELYDQYSGALYGVILRICKDEAKAQDLLQEVFIKIWQNSEKYDDQKGRFYTWAYRIARNTTLNSLRGTVDLIQNADLSVYTERTEEEDTQPAVAPLKGAIKKLEVHHQKAIDLVYYQGLTHREAHQVMGVPLGTFKSYVQQALKKLRELHPGLVIIGGVLIEWML